MILLLLLTFISKFRLQPQWLSLGMSIVSYVPSTLPEKFAALKYPFIYWVLYATSSIESYVLGITLVVLLCV